MALFYHENTILQTENIPLTGEEISGMGLWSYGNNKKIGQNIYKNCF